MFISTKDLDEADMVVLVRKGQVRILKDREGAAPRDTNIGQLLARLCIQPAGDPNKPYSE